jgi:hypothetical protein
MRKRLATLALLVALGLAGTAVAKADPEPGSNTGNSFVCNGNQADPPTCPGK